MARLVNLNRRAYETQREAKHESLRPTPQWLEEIRKRVQNSSPKPPFDWESYERERLAKHVVNRRMARSRPEGATE